MQRSKPTKPSALSPPVPPLRGFFCSLPPALRLGAEKVVAGNVARIKRPSSLVSGPFGHKIYLFVTTHLLEGSSSKDSGCALKTCYAIIKTRSSYGSETNISLVLDETESTHLSFSSPEEARGWMRRIAGRKDYLGRNESSPPTYAVTKVGSERFCDAYKRTWGGTGRL
jgi:hypothetical protein